MGFSISAFSKHCCTYRCDHFDVHRVASTCCGGFPANFPATFSGDDKRGLTLVVDQVLLMRSRHHYFFGEFVGYDIRCYIYSSNFICSIEIAK